MPLTTLQDMQIVPEKFTRYTIQRTTEKSTLVRSGLFTSNPMISQLINGKPYGGNIIEMPHWKPLTGEDEIFGEGRLTENKIETGNECATLLARGKMWGDTDLSHVFGGDDPLGAVVDLLSDWWVEREQAIVLSILKGITDKTSGALKDHVNDISGGSGAASVINDIATLETKQFMGDAYNKLGLVFMHSATYTELQKQMKIITTYDPTKSININTYLNFEVIVDDGMPVNGDVYDTYFMGRGVFARVDGTPIGFVTYEKDRDKAGGKNYLINRRAMVIHPLGVSWTYRGKFDNGDVYAHNKDLANPANWELATDHKNVPITVLRHKISGQNVTSFAIPKNLTPEVQTIAEEDEIPVNEPEQTATPEQAATSKQSKTGK